MSRRVVVPVLLLLAAACSVAAVFAVHRIEARGGPVSQPSLVPPAFSPNGDGWQDETTINFTTRQRELITVDVLTVDGERVHRLVDREPLRGEQQLDWDGSIEGGTIDDGSYRIVIRRAGDDRPYGPPARLVVDTTPPVGILDRATLKPEMLVGLAFLAGDEHLEVFDADGTQLADDLLRQFRPKPAAQGAQPEGPVPADTIATRFTAMVDATPSRIDVVDRAGNRRTVFPGRRVEYKTAPR